MAQRIKIPPDLMAGDVDEGYGAVADAFRRNLSSGDEVGAAVAVYRDGRKVVDLWGGYRNLTTRAPWEKDTIVNVFSTTKGVAALTVAVAASRGLIDYDAKVADYWPEFAQAGKGAVTVRQLLGHQAGLPIITPPLTLADIADPQRRTLGRYFAEEIAVPLDLDFHIGLPASVDRNRVALLHPFAKRDAFLHLNSVPPRLAAAFVSPFSLVGRATTLAAGVKEADAFNRDELRVLEIPAGNGTGTARSVAKLYGSAATGGSELGLSRTVREALEGPAEPPTMGVR